MECADKRALDTNKPRLRILSVHMTVFHLSSVYWFQKSTHITGPLLINQQGCRFCSGYLCDLILHPFNQPFTWHILIYHTGIKELLMLICQSKFGHNFLKKILKSAKNLLIV